MPRDADGGGKPMKKIVLRNLSADLQELIADRMNDEKCDPSAAVTAILKDAAIERMIEHDVAIVKEWWQEAEPESRPAPVSCGHVHITIQCDSARRPSRCVER